MNNQNNLKEVESMVKEQPRAASNEVEQEILNRMNAQEELLRKTYVSVEKTRKYFMWTLIITLVVFVVPLIAMMFILPSFISSMTQGYSGLL